MLTACRANSLIGHARTLELLLRARVLPASHPSYNLLFTELLDKPEDVFPAAMAMAKEMCELNSVLSMASIKAMVWHGYPTAEEQHLLDSEAMGAHGNSPDGKEGVKSFMEKRPVNCASRTNRVFAETDRARRSHRLNPSGSGLEALVDADRRQGP